MKKTKLLLTLCLLTLLSSPSFAITYIFTGSGSWDTPSNWQGGVSPSFNYYDSAIIVGNCTLTVQSTFKNRNVIWIKAGGTLNLVSNNQADLFTQEFGTQLKIDGTLNNSVTIMNSGDIFITGTINNYYSFTNGWPFALQSGATFNNTSTGLFASGQIALDCGSHFINNGKLYGTFTLSGCGGVTNNGIVAPGNSPGTITLSGDYTATSSAVHNFEIGGTGAGAYDKLTVSGTATLNGTLNVTLYNGYVPQGTDNIPIITGTISGTFSSVTLPSGYSLAYKANAVEVHGNTVLPLTFLSLAAKKLATGVELDWMIDNQEGIKQYEVEKSTNGTAFVKLGVVAASNQKAYHYTDATPNAMSFYRVKSVGLSGHISYSSVVKFSNSGSSVDVKLFPNPATTSLVVQHPTTDANSRIIVNAIDGRPVFIQALRAGVQQTELNIATLPKGTYTAKFESGSQTETLKFVKL